MLSGEIIALYCDSDTKHLSVLVLGKVRSFYIKEDGTSIYHCALRGLLANELKGMKAEIFCGIAVLLSKEFTPHHQED
jgi:hypothetical protein